MDAPPGQLHGAPCSEQPYALLNAFVFEPEFCGCSPMGVMEHKREQGHQYPWTIIHLSQTLLPYPHITCKKLNSGRSMIPGRSVRFVWLWLIIHQPRFSWERESASDFEKATLFKETPMTKKPYHSLCLLHFLPCISQLLMLKMIHKKRKKGKSTVLFLFQSSVSLRETVCVSRHEIKMVE